MPAELHSIYDLTTFCRKTTGDVPAKLVGASTTVVGTKMYLFGGRLVSERRMVADLYVFNLETYNWEKIHPFPEDDIPRARYFHSVDTWNNQLIVFGGMSNEPDSPNPDDLCVLNDVRFFDIASRHWLPPSRLPTPENLLPRARYAQLSSVTGDRLFIIGGQDFYNTWLDDVCVYDLLAKTWSERRDYPRHCGSYRSVAVSSNQCVRFPKEEMRSAPSRPSGPRFQAEGNAPTNEDITSADTLAHLPYSAAPTDEHPSDIYLYSNYNFTDVKRELESFSIWVLDLQTMVWSRIDPGKAAFGIYQPPPLRLDIPMQEVGLAALEEGVLADFEIVCDDGRKIACSRKMLEERWGCPMHIALPELAGNVPDERRADPRLTPRALNLSEPYPITMALLQVGTSTVLPWLTPAANCPAVLSQLLVLATTYNITHLQTLVKHAMHRALSNSTSVGVYEVATLQIRALKTVMSYTQKKPSRAKPEKDGSGGGGGGGSGGGPSNHHHQNGRDGGGDSGKYSSTRPRGTSDARWGMSNNSSSEGGMGGRGGGYNNYGTQRSEFDFEALDELEEQEEEGEDVEFGSALQGYGRSRSSSSSYRRNNYLLDDEDVDQLFTLPAFPTKQRSHGRTDSVVSVRTENEINELISLMAPLSPTSPTPSALRHSKSDQSFMDELFREHVGSPRDETPRRHQHQLSHSSTKSHPYGYRDSRVSELSSDNENDESSYYPESSRASGNDESESDSGFEMLTGPSAPTSPNPRIIAYHLPRRVPSQIDTRRSNASFDSRATRESMRRSNGSLDTNTTRLSTPSLMSMSSSSKSSSSSAYAYPVTPPHSPDTLPIIEERRYAGGYSGDEDPVEETGEEEDEFERRIGMHSAAAHGGKQSVQRMRDGNPWPTQKSRVEWITSAKSPSLLVYNAEKTEAPPKGETTRVVVMELKKVAPEKERSSVVPSTPATPPARVRALSPTPSDAETVSPRASTSTSTFAAARSLLGKKKGSSVESLSSPKSPKMPMSPTSLMSPLSPSPSVSGFFIDAKETKAAKADEKKRKKEASKARMEELARSLKEKSKKAKEDADRASSKSKDRSRTAEPVTMFGGVSAGMTL
ncbi:hypothetical protein R3P38DRAFT_2869785 [Favolaschia claudopus]|uniref:Galactose oxidase n=1 Tax=Favolaschia claudopus TaxID=2862362 RepID=A0AAW0DBZ4_9AGAR